MDKSTLIFERTIAQQEKEIERLNERVLSVSSSVATTKRNDARRTSDELELVSSTLAEISRGQELLTELLSESSRQMPPEMANALAEIRDTVAARLDTKVPQAIRARDLSLYPVLVSRIQGWEQLQVDLAGQDYTVNPYPEMGSPVDSQRQEGIWVGESVPGSHAVEIIQRGRRHWPFLKYVHLSDGKHGPPETLLEMYLGGSSESAKTFLRCEPWLDNDFSLLDPGMSPESFHACYQDEAAVFGIEPVELISGSVPRTQQRLVEAWAEIHQQELTEDWNRLQAGRPPAKIEPLR